MRTQQGGRGASLRDRYLKAPWWVISLTTGTFYGACMTLAGYLQHPGNWTIAIVLGLIQGVIFGAVMGPLQIRQRRKMVAAIGDLPGSDLRVASKAVMRGPVPIDPDIRRAAYWLAANQLNGLSQFRWLGLILFAVITMGSVAIALTVSPWWWLGAAAMLSMLAFFLLMPIHLRRRIEMLKLEAPEETAATHR